MTKQNIKNPGRKIREYRKRYHMSQDDLAHDLGCDGSTVSYWETGRSKPSTRFVFMLQEKMGIIWYEWYR